MWQASSRRGTLALCAKLRRSGRAFVRERCASVRRRDVHGLRSCRRLARRRRGCCSARGGAPCGRRSEGRRVRPVQTRHPSAHRAARPHAHRLDTLAHGPQAELHASAHRRRDCAPRCARARRVGHAAACHAAGRARMRRLSVRRLGARCVVGADHVAREERALRRAPRRAHVGVRGEGARGVLRSGRVSDEAEPGRGLGRYARACEREGRRAGRLLPSVIAQPRAQRTVSTRKSLPTASAWLRMACSEYRLSSVSITFVASGSPAPHA